MNIQSLIRARTHFNKTTELCQNLRNPCWIQYFVLLVQHLVSNSDQPIVLEANQWSMEGLL